MNHEGCTKCPELRGRDCHAYGGSIPLKHIPECPMIRSGTQRLLSVEETIPLLRKGKTVQIITPNRLFNDETKPIFARKVVRNTPFITIKRGHRGYTEAITEPSITTDNDVLLMFPYKSLFVTGEASHGNAYFLSDGFPVLSLKFKYHEVIQVQEEFQPKEDWDD